MPFCVAGKISENLMELSYHSQTVLQGCRLEKKTSLITRRFNYGYRRKHQIRHLSRIRTHSVDFLIIPLGVLRLDDKKQCAKTDIKLPTCPNEKLQSVFLLTLSF